jgi:hypothetical protein
MLMWLNSYTESMIQKNSIGIAAFKTMAAAQIARLLYVDLYAYRVWRNIKIDRAILFIVQ